MKDESDEEEDEKDPAGELKTAANKFTRRTTQRRTKDVLLPTISLANSWKPSEELLVLLKRVGQNHKEPADDTEVAEKK